MEIRELTEVAAFRRCEEIQRRVWGASELEVTPASHLSAVVHVGGLVAGALREGTLLGFVYGFPSYHPERGVGLHSHQLAVCPEARGQGLGQQLKWFQRDWCLFRGISWITWTFDPLRAKNAKLNLEHLGAHARSYLVDLYGTLSGPLGGSLPSDRLLAAWPLEDPRVVALRRAAAPEVTVPAGAFVALRVGGNGEPKGAEAPPDAVTVWLEVPADYPEGGALAWRLALRGAMLPLFEAGYRATRFVSGGYLLERSAASDKT